MSMLHPGHIDPVTKSKIITPTERVATMGSCFAQHLAKHIGKSGLNYFVSEQAPLGMGIEEAKLKNYGVFSARYGNVYTVKQAVQLFDRAFGYFKPKKNPWQRQDGKWVDPFRPQIDPNGFASIHDVNLAEEEHLEQVRNVFTQSQWLIFTLGLTEAWQSKIDGSIYPIAPGVSGGNYDPSEHHFVNFSLSEVWQDLDQFIQKIMSINNDIKILLTVSPVPLMATAENRHVLVSTVLSKSILRVAADQAERKYPNVIYFPSYEIIISPAAGGRYYEDDLRRVTTAGVSHVMRIFSKHFIANPKIDNRIFSKYLYDYLDDIICDEEAIDKYIRCS